MVVYVQLVRHAFAALTLAALAALALPCRRRAHPRRAGSPGFDAALAAQASGFQRQQDVFATLENGLSLDAIFDPADVQSVRDFFAQSATDDFQAFSGKHPYEAIASFDEHGDEGNFAGISSVGVAARLIVLRAERAPAAEVDRAAWRRRARGAAWHVYGAIGGAGVVARGVRRVRRGARRSAVPGRDADAHPAEGRVEQAAAGEEGRGVARARRAGFPAGYGWTTRARIRSPATRSRRPGCGTRCATIRSCPST